MTSNGGKSWALTTQRNLEINSIAVHPDDPQRVFIATNNYGVMVSHDGGKNFVPTNENFTSRFTYSVTPDISQPHRLYATTRNTASSGGFVFFSDNSGTTWTQATGVDVNRVSPFTILQDRVDPNRMLLGTNIGVFRSLDRGVSWTRIEPPKPKVVRKTPVAKGKVPAAKTAAATKKPVPVKAPSTTAPPEETGPQIVPALTDTVKVLTFTEDDKNGIYAGTDTGLYRTYDIDKGWEKLPFGSSLSESVFVIHTAPQLPGTIWVGTATSGVVVSRDDGKTWNRVDGLPQGVPVSSIAIDPKRPNHIYVGTVQALYMSRDGGRTWNFGRGLPLGNYTSILIDPNNPDEIFIASALESDGGIFYSEDGGSKWRRIDSKGMKVPSRRVWTMAFDPSNSRTIFAGSHSSGVYRIERQAESAVKDDKPADKTTGNGN